MRTKPIGTGPFKFVEYRRGKSIKLVKNPDYWKKGRPYLDGIEFKIVENRSTRILAFSAGDFDMTFPTDITIPLGRDMKSQAPKAICEYSPTGVANNLIVNRSAAPFDKPEIRRAMSLALDRESFSKILAEGQSKVGGAMLPAPQGEWGMPKELLEKLTGYGGTVEQNQAEARKIMEGLGYGPGKPLKVKVATRNIAVYRDAAVILIDQLKKIHIEGELENVDTPQWYPKVARKDYAVGMNLTGRQRRRSGRQPGRELRLQERAQLHGILQSGGRPPAGRAIEGVRQAEAQGDRLADREAAGRRRGAPDHRPQHRRHLLAPSREGLRGPRQLDLQQHALRGSLAGQMTAPRRLTARPHSIQREARAKRVM